MKFLITIAEKTFIGNTHADKQKELPDFIEPALVVIKKTSQTCLQSANQIRRLKKKNHKNRGTKSTPEKPKL